MKQERKSLLFPFPIDIQYFGGGGSSTTTVQKRDPKSAEHLAMDKSVYDTMNQLIGRYGGTAIPKASVMPTGWGADPSLGSMHTGTAGTVGGSALGTRLNTADTLNDLANWNSIYLQNALPTYINQSDSALGRADALASAYKNPYLAADFDPYIQKMGDVADSTTQFATQYYDDADFYLGQNKDLVSRGGSQALDTLMGKVYESLHRNYQQNASSLLNQAAQRGVVNSSISQKMLGDLGSQISNAAADQYLSGYGTLLDSTLKGAQTAGELARGVVSTGDQSISNFQNVVNSMLGVNQGELQAMLGQTGALTDVAAGHNKNYLSALQGLETLAGLPTQYYEGAMAPLVPAYNYWRDLTNAYYGHEDYDTVVKQGK